MVPIVCKTIRVLNLNPPYIKHLPLPVIVAVLWFYKYQLVGEQ